MFNKKEYWKNREAKKRGQGDKLQDAVGFTPAREYKPEPKKLSRYAIRKNTKRARKAA